MHLVSTGTCCTSVKVFSLASSSCAHQEVNIVDSGQNITMMHKHADVEHHITVCPPFASASSASVMLNPYLCEPP